MLGWPSKRKGRRRKAREKRVQSLGSGRAQILQSVFCWPVLASAVLVLGVVSIGLLGESVLRYSVGQRVLHPIYARVDFQIADPAQTEANRQAARASTPSYYTWNAKGVTFDRIRADLRSFFEAAAGADSFEAYAKALESVPCEPDEDAFQRLRVLAELPDDQGRAKFGQWVDSLPLESEYVVQGLLNEPREPSSTTGFIILEQQSAEEKSNAKTKQIPITDLVRQETTRALQGSASTLSKRFPFPVRASVEAILLATLRDQPTIIFDSDQTREELKKAQEATPKAMSAFERGKPFVNPSLLGSEQLALLKAHHQAYLDFLAVDIEVGPQNSVEKDIQQELRRERLFHQIGMAALIVVFSVGLVIYAGQHQPRILQVRGRTIAFGLLVLGTLFAVRGLNLSWPDIPELIYVPCILAGSVLAIVYPRRFAVGAVCILSVLAGIAIRAEMTQLLVLFTGVTVATFQLNEIRTRTKLITSGAITAIAVGIVSAAGGLLGAAPMEYVLSHALTAGGCAMLASFIVSGALPFIEQSFGVATSLALLEWRDPTKPLLQLLAREAPGTYNHSLVLGTLAESACEAIDANALLAQVGALYHDVGKIPKAEYFVENQIGTLSRHDNLAPTMSLLIILGHVKDGVEMAKEYKLPRILRQFIEEHHGTTVVRYFHHMASEKQPQIASGKHDREVPEAEFRYGGPKPRTRESAVIMLADGVEGAVRALPDPTVSRIEGIVHQIVADRLSDGQFGDCDITLRELRIVEDSLVKSLCSIYHGRVAYPKSQKESDDSSDAGADGERKRASG